MGHVNTRERRMRGLRSSTALTLAIGWMGAFSPGYAQSVGTTGAVTPTQTPNPSPAWNVDGEPLIVGTGAVGTLNVSDGGKVEVSASAPSQIGAEAGGIGTASIDGTGSSISVLKGGLRLGVAGGRGTVSVTDNGRLNIIGGVIVTTVGNATRYQSYDQFHVGYDSPGKLIIDKGGRVGASLMVLGFGADGPGEVVVDGAGSLLEIDENLSAGWVGGGTVTVSNGATLRTQFNSTVPIAARDAIAPDSVGGGTGSTTLVTDVGSRWDSGTGIQIGTAGGSPTRGTLTVEDGAHVSAERYIQVGRGRDTVNPTNVGGSLVVDNASLTTSVLQVGIAGSKARVSFVDGAQVTSEYFVAGGGGTYWNGAAYYSDTEITVSGPGTLWTNTGSSSPFSLGTGGKVVMELLDQATLRVASDFSVGAGGDADPSTASLTVGGGAQAFVGGHAAIGESGDIVGSVTVQDQDSLLNIAGATVVGGATTGNLTVKAAGTVDVGAEMAIGAEQGGTGHVRVTDASSLLEIGDFLNVGTAGAGQLLVGDQGRVTVANNSLIAWGTGSTGQASVTGVGSTWVSGGYLAVGNSGQGTLLVTDGGVVESKGQATSGSGGSRIARLQGSTGTATVTGAGSRWDTGDNLIVGYAGNGTLSVENGGTVSAKTIEIAREATGTGNLIVGGANAAAAVGIIDAGSIVFGAGAGALIFNHTGPAYTFDIPVSGNGTIRTLAGSTRLAGNHPGFGGQIDVAAGTLNLAGELANASAVVGTGGTLVGTGRIKNLTVDGTVSPGNSIGTLTVADNLTFNPGSTLAVEIAAPDQADRISVGGTATINGSTIAVTKLSTEEQYASGQSYRLIDASLVRRNADFTVNQPFLFLQTGLAYASDYVDLILSKPGNFRTTAQTFNQRQSARALNQLAQNGNALTVYNELLFLPDADAARQAFNLASGEIHASGQHVINQGFTQFSRALRGQAAAGVAGALPASPSAPRRYATLQHPMTMSDADPALDLAGATAGNGNSWAANAWLRPLGGRGAIDADGNAGELDWWTAGIAGGYERPIEVADGRAWVGVGLGYLRGNGAIDGRRSTLDADNFQIGTYGGWAVGSWTLSSALAYGASRVETERHVVFGGVNRAAKADYWAHSIGFSGELSYAFDINPRTALLPLVAIDTGWSHSGGFTEAGAGALNLSGGSESWSRADTGLGAAIAHTVPVEMGRLTFATRAVWQHAFADVTPDQALSFAGSATGFQVRGADTGRNQAVVGAGTSWQMSDDLALRITYDGVFSGRQQSHGGSIGVNFRF